MLRVAEGACWAGEVSKEDRRREREREKPSTSREANQAKDSGGGGGGGANKLVEASKQQVSARKGEIWTRGDGRREVSQRKGRKKKGGCNCSG